MNDTIARHFSEPDRCPYCGRTHIEGASVDIQATTARQQVTCVDCQRPWTDVYRLNAIIDDAGTVHERSRKARVDQLALEDRDMRQREIVPPDRLAETRATVIGVGAIGRQVALQLTAMGVPWLQLIDPDTVEPVNLAPQGFGVDDLGLHKVTAVGDACHHLNPRLEVHEHRDRFRRSMTNLGNTIFCCVDAIETRQHIWYAVQDTVEFFADGRMSAETIRVLTASDIASRQHYVTTLFRSSEAYQGACTARSTIFTASIAAGLMIEQFTRHLRHIPTDADLQLNLLSSELTVS